MGAPYGDPAADEALASDVAAGRTPEHDRMHEYIRARTAFFDRVLVTALDRGVKQVVIGGAGYDGRALRYAKPGVRWFEVDHPATQADKRERKEVESRWRDRLGAGEFTALRAALTRLVGYLDPALPDCLPVSATACAPGGTPDR